MSFLAWLEATGLSTWIRESPSLWGFPFILFLHTLGLALVAGLSVALNLWVLGFAARLGAAPLGHVFPVIRLGFAINLVSGLLLLVAYPTKALTDPVFYLKLTLVAAALAQVEWLRRRVFAGADAAADVGARLAATARIRVTAGLAIGLWAGAVLTGRLLAYTYNYLTAADLMAAGLQP